MEPESGLVICLAIGHNLGDLRHGVNAPQVSGPGCGHDDEGVQAVLSLGWGKRNEVLYTSAQRGIYSIVVATGSSDP